MRILLDEDLPRRLGTLLTGHEFSTVPRSGWTGIRSGRRHDLQRLLGSGTARATGATVFAYHVSDPQRYGVIEFDAPRPTAP